MATVERSRVQQWLDSIPSPDNAALPPDSPLRPDTTKVRLAKRVCRGLDAVQYPSSPPLTMDEETPRSRKRSKPTEIGDTPRPIFPMPRRNKSNSPVKDPRSLLESLQKPYRIRGWATPDLLVQRLPEDIIPLFEQFYSAQTLKQNIIPHELRSKMGRFTPESSFRPPAVPATGDNTTDNTEAAAEAKARAFAVYATVCFVFQKAAEAVIYTRHESTWNEHIHARLLELVFTSTPLGTDAMTTMDMTPLLDPPPPPPATTKQNKARVRYENVNHAPIVPGWEAPFAANYDGSGGGGGGGGRASSSVRSSAASTTTDDNNSVFGPARTGSTAAGRNTSSGGPRGSDSRKVDYVLVLDLPPTHALQRALRRQAAGPDGGSGCVNQTAYRPVERSLIACSMETKNALPQVDALFQLGIWAAAWHRRMYELRPRPDPGLELSQQKRLVTLPLIQTVGHGWTVYFACDRGDYIDLYGPMAIGGTDDILSCFVLLTCLQHLKSWIEGTFQDAMKAWFMVEDDDGGDDDE